MISRASRRLHYRRWLVVSTTLTACCGTTLAAQTMPTPTTSATNATTDQGTTGTGTPSSSPQASTSSTDAVPGDIIVTAQKRSERLRDVPVSITAVSGEQLKAQGITTPEMLVKVTPGFSLNKTVYGTPVFYIRGVGFNDTALGASPAVSAYTDQLPIPYSPEARGATLDLERVEVLKGPQGTLFGQNSTGGAINFIAAKPTDELHAGFDLTYGRFDEVDAEAFVSGPISNTLTARIAVRNEYRGDWQRGYTTSESLGEKNFHNGRLIIDWKPVDKLKVELSATGWKDQSESQQPQFVKFDPQLTGPRATTIPYPIQNFPAAPKNDRAAAWDPERSFQQDNWFYQFGGRIDLAISDKLNLTSLTSYSKFSQHVLTDFDSTTYPVTLATQDGGVRSFTQELRLSGSIAEDRLKWVLGGNYQDDRVFDRLFENPITVSSVPFVRAFRVDNLQRVKTKSVFGSIDIKLTEHLTAQGSARYSKQDRAFSGCFYDNGDGSAAALFSVLVGHPLAAGSCLTPNPANPGTSGVTGSLNEDNVSWRGGLNWKPDTNTLIYANVTKGYKSGSFPTIPYITPDTYAPVKQESVLAYELGTKLSLFSHALEVDGALFYYDYNDKQLNGFVNTAVGISPALVTVPKAKVKGAEINTILRPIRGLTITAGGTYIDTRIDRNPVDRVTGQPVSPTDYLGNPSNYVGLSFPNIPKWQGTGDAQYRFPVSGTLAAYVGSSATYHSSTSSNLKSGIASADALVKIPHYILVDIRAGVETQDGKWRLEAWGRNVTNKYYLIGTLRFADYYTRFTGMPATYGASLYFRY